MIYSTFNSVLDFDVIHCCKPWINLIVAIIVWDNTPRSLFDGFKNMNENITIRSFRILPRSKNVKLVFNILDYLNTFIQLYAVPYLVLRNVLNTVFRGEFMNIELLNRNCFSSGSRSVNKCSISATISNLVFPRMW